MTTRRIPMLLTTFAFLAGAGHVSAQVEKQKPCDCAATASERSADALKLPQTPDDHLALARGYDAKAARYREEAQAHRRMLAEEVQHASGPPRKGASLEPGWLAKKREHCEGYIWAADQLAAEASKFAEYHRLRAAELQGK